MRVGINDVEKKTALFSFCLFCFSLKKQIVFLVVVLKFIDHIVSVTVIHLHCCNTKVAIGNNK